MDVSNSGAATEITPVASGGGGDGDADGDEQSEGGHSLLLGTCRDVSIPYPNDQLRRFSNGDPLLARHRAPRERVPQHPAIRAHLVRIPHVVVGVGRAGTWSTPCEGMRGSPRCRGPRRAAMEGNGRSLKVGEGSVEGHRSLRCGGVWLRRAPSKLLSVARAVSGIARIYQNKV